MRLIFLFLFAIAAALSSVHAQTPLVFTSNATLPSSPAGSPVSIPVQITGGTQPYTFNLKKGQTLPTGLVLNNSTGVISGTPRGPSSTEIQVQVSQRGRALILDMKRAEPRHSHIFQALRGKKSL